jgi:hypothetical protein
MHAWTCRNCRVALGIEETLEESLGYDRDRAIEREFERRRKQQTLNRIVGWK